MIGSPNSPMVSVIVPVREADGLAMCLSALEAQTYDERRYEVIVVDNGSPVSVEQVAAGFPHARVVAEPRTGSYAARNRGLAEARGTILAFTDADCRPAPAWLEVGVSAVTLSPERGLVGGRIDVEASDPTRPSLPELYELRHAFPQQDYVRHLSFAVTANMFTRQDVIAAIGPFRADLQSGGDREWGSRVAAAGLEVVYEPRAVVAHPARRTWREVRAKLSRVIAGDLARTGAPEPVAVRAMARHLLPPVRGIVRVWRSGDWDLSTMLRYAAAITIARQLAVFTAIDARWRTRP